MNSTDLKIIESIVVPTLNKRERLSDYLPGHFNTIYSKKGIKKAIKSGLVKINGKKAFTADYVFGNERIDLFAIGYFIIEKQLRQNFVIVNYFRKKYEFKHFIKTSI